MIESCFDKLEELEAVIGEPISITNQEKMNNKRMINRLDTIGRVNLATNAVLCFALKRLEHSKDQAKYCVSSEYSKDAFVKLPTTSKDMLEELIKNKPSNRNRFKRLDLFTLGFPLQCLL